MSEASAEELTGAPVNEAPTGSSGFGEGGNQQDLPSDIRTGVIPPEGSISQQTSQGQPQEQEGQPSEESSEAEESAEGSTQEQPQEEPREPDTTEYGDFKDVVGDLYDDPMTAPAARWLEGELKDVDIDRAFGNMLRNGDTNLIDKKYLAEKLGDKADQVIDYAKMLNDYGAAKSEQQMQSIYDKFGGEDAAKKAGQYYAANATESDRTAISRMLDSGDPSLVEYAVQQITAFAKDQGATVNHNSPAFGEQATEKGLSSAEFRSQAAKAKSEQEYQSLMEKRRLGERQGL